jgi:hypothetical protein
MQYSVIEPPSYKPFREMNRQEARAYYAWLMAQIPDRIATLERAVRSSPRSPDEHWTANQLPESFDSLGSWLADHITTEPIAAEFNRRRSEQLENIAPQYRAMFETPNSVLTDVTFSLIIDVGLYFGEALRSCSSQLAWQLWTKHKQDVDYQQSVIVGFERGTHCNPKRLVHTFALGVVDKTTPASRLRELFANWASRVAT